MQSENRVFDDLVRLLNGAAGTLAGVGREAESSARARAREWIGGLDFVGRDEFEAVKAMAAAARDEADALRARLDVLEKQAAGAGPSDGGRSAAKPSDGARPAAEPIDDTRTPGERPSDDAGAPSAPAGA